MSTLSPIEEVDSPATALAPHLPSPEPEAEIETSEATPGPAPVEGEKEFDPTYGLGLDGFIEGIEPPWDYLHGGHHAVHLEDNLGANEEYRVIHKLGTGGFANVWLCRVLGEEPTKYVAVKILMAHLSGGQSRELENIDKLKQLAQDDPAIEEYCLLPIDYFEIDGRNGRHQCFVYPVAGQTVSQIWGAVEDPHEYLRDLTRQAAEAMAVLHRNGICHGDFRPSNILLRADWLNGLSEEDVLDILGEPLCAEIIVKENATRKAFLPGYIVYPVQWGGFKDRDKFASSKICIIDFGEAFEDGNPPPGGVGIPLHYASPELALHSYCWTLSDVFALAATMFEIRTGGRIFRAFDESIHGYLYSMVIQRGPLTEEWWRDFVEEWKKAYLSIRGGDTVPEDIGTEEVVRRKHIHEHLVEHRVFHLLSLPDSTDRGWHQHLPEDERELFEDLIFEMTWHEPPMRPSVEEVLRHPWFSYKPGPVDSPKPAEPESGHVEETGADCTEATEATDTAFFMTAEPYQADKAEPISIPGPAANSTSGFSTLEVSQAGDDSKTDWFEAPEHQPTTPVTAKMDETGNQQKKEKNQRAIAHVCVYLHRAARAVKSVFRA